MSTSSGLMPEHEFCLTGLGIARDKARHKTALTRQYVRHACAMGSSRLPNIKIPLSSHDGCQRIWDPDVIWHTDGSSGAVDGSQVMDTGMS